MSDYKPTPDDVEKEKVMDMLMTQKHLTDLYNASTNEIDCSSLHNENLNILKEEHELEHKLYQEIKKRGWYDASKTDEKEIDKINREYTRRKNEMGI